MYRALQNDLCRLRLDTAREFVRCVLGGDAPSALVAGGATFHATATVTGVGPLFRINITMHNGSSRAVPESGLLEVVPDADPLKYALDVASVPVTQVPPGSSVAVSVGLRCIDPTGAPGSRVRCIVTQSHVPQLHTPAPRRPIVVVVLDMPVAEIEI